MNYTRLSLFLFGFISFLNIQLYAQVEENHFDYMDLFDLQMVSNPEISPDGAL